MTLELPLSVRRALDSSVVMFPREIDTRPDSCIIDLSGNLHLETGKAVRVGDGERVRVVAPQQRLRFEVDLRDLVLLRSDLMQWLKADPSITRQLFPSRMGRLFGAELGLRELARLDPSLKEDNGAALMKLAAFGQALKIWKVRAPNLTAFVLHATLGQPLFGLRGDSSNAQLFVTRS